MKPTNRITVPRVPWHEEEEHSIRPDIAGTCPDCGGDLLVTNPLGGEIICDTCEYRTHD